MSKMNPAFEKKDYIVSEDRPQIKAHSNTEFCPLIYELIPAHGCSFECSYCNVYSLNENKTFHPVTVFKNYPDLVSETIDEHRKKGESPVYYFSPKTDVFQHALVDTKITHKILEVLVKKQAPFILVTKGKLPDNDILELLKQSKEKGRVLISYGMKNDIHAKVLEPFAASLEERYDLARKCSENSIPAMGIIEPILPFKDLSFVRDIIKKFIDLRIDHFAIDFARISKVCLEGLIEKLPDLEELREVYFDKDAISQTFETGPYFREKVTRYAPSEKYHIENFNLIKNYAEDMGGTVSKCNYFKVQGINTGAYKRGFLCFGIYDPKRAAEFLKMHELGQI
jgi:DNA repair photolyase